MINSYGVRSSLIGRVMARGSVVRRLDWVIIACVVALGVISSLLIFSATRAQLIDQHQDPAAFLKKNLLNLAIGLVLGGLVTALDYRLLRAHAPILYALSCLGLIAVLSPLGATVNGAHAWILLGAGFQVEPSEFAKVALVVLLAMIVGEPRDGESRTGNSGPGLPDILLSLGLGGLPMALIMLEPDLGVTLTFGAIILGVLAVSGVRRLWLFGLTISAVLTAAAVVLLGVLKPYQIARFSAFLNPAADPRGAGYNAQQALIAIGSGGFFGTGLFRGEQTTGHFVPEQQTDFIFTVAGEELGFVGSAVIVLLLGILIWRGLRIATQAADLFGTLVATGVVVWLAFQTFENVGMTVGIMPITGLPLPLVSYGGSATFANMLGLGLLQAVHIRSRPG
jgi:rod shape determining protein RodA